MENTAEIQQNEVKPSKKRGFWGWCAVVIRWMFILLCGVILLGGLYFKAPWKILLLDGVLLALLTVVPRRKRKYGWLTLAVAVLIVTVWIFIPEKDTGDWRPYTFDAELAALEAERIVSPEDDAAPLYEALFQRWKQIEENDPFPEEADDEWVTMERPWMAEEFPKIAEWFGRHGDFFDDLILTTQKSCCYFPAAVKALELSKSMDRLSPVKKFALHLNRLSCLDLGEDNNVTGALNKQIAILNLGKHINQQPMFIDMLVGVSIEALGYDALKKTIIQQPFQDEITTDHLQVITHLIRTSHFDHQEKLKRILACEKLLAKNAYGMMYEINSEGKIRSSHSKSIMNTIQNQCPDEELAELSNSYWRAVSFKISKLFLWFSGQPKDPMEVSEWVDEAYRPLEEAVQNESGTSEIDSAPPIPFELNYEYLIKRITQIALPSYKRIQGQILPKVQIQKQGAEIVCGLVFYKKQQGQFPNNLKELWRSEEVKQRNSELYTGFIYEKTDDSFKLYHIGQNGIDENGHYGFPEHDPNEVDIRDLKPEPDDILIWPDELGDSD